MRLVIEQTDVKILTMLEGFDPILRLTDQIALPEENYVLKRWVPAAVSFYSFQDDILPRYFVSVLFDTPLNRIFAPSRFLPLRLYFQIE